MLYARRSNALDAMRWSNWQAFCCLRSLFLPRHKLALEAVGERQQLAVFKRKQPRPKLDGLWTTGYRRAGPKP